MRTTVELDPDVASKVHAVARERGVSFDEALNSTLRRGLASAAGGSKRRYRLVSRQLGLRPDVELDRALALADEIDDVGRIRKLEDGK